MQFKRSTSLLMIIVFVSVLSPVVVSQVNMQNMPGMKMGNSNTTRKRKTPKKKPVARRHNMGKMAGMNMPAMKTSSTHRMRHRRRARSRSSSESTKKPGMQNMPGMNMPRMTMPKSPASPTPKRQGETQMNMPGMQRPSASPSPQASPSLHAASCCPASRRACTE